METCIRSAGNLLESAERVRIAAALVLCGTLVPAPVLATGLTREASAACTAAPSSPPVPADARLGLRDAVAAALVANPDLAVVACDVRVAEAEAVQAGLLPNPTLGLDVENIGGSGERRDDEQAETTVVLSQLFELGGKRGKRARVASLARDLAAWDYASRRLSVVSATVKAFVTTLAAQERVLIADARAQVAEKTVRGVAAKIDAGAAPSVDLARARVAVGRAEVLQQRAARDLAAARSSLAATWGSRQPRFARVEGSLRSLEMLPATQSAAPSVGNNPDVARWETEQFQRATALALAEAGRIPDVTIGAGGRYFSDNGDGAVVVELSIPLPMFDWGQGAAGIARHRLTRAAAERRAAERTAEAALTVANARLEAARAEATLLRDRLLPSARRAVTAADEAFRRGLIHFTDLLDAELTAFELREEEILALETAHLAAVDVARLTGSTPATPAIPGPIGEESTE